MSLSPSGSAAARPRGPPRATPARQRVALGDRTHRLDVLVQRRIVRTCSATTCTAGAAGSPLRRTPSPTAPPSANAGRSPSPPPPPPLRRARRLAVRPRAARGRNAGTRCRSASRPPAHHLRVPLLHAHPPLLPNQVLDRHEALGPLRPPPALVPQHAPLARQLRRATRRDVHRRPAEHPPLGAALPRIGRIASAAQDALRSACPSRSRHQPERPMHRRERLDRAAYRLPPQPERVTSWAASHTSGSNSSTSSHRSLCTRVPRTLRCDPASSSTRLPLLQQDPTLRRLGRQHAPQQRPIQQRTQVLVHLLRLLERTAQDPHLHPRLEQQVQQRRRRPQHRLPPAPARPHHRVTPRRPPPLEKRVAQVVERRSAAGLHRHTRHPQPEHRVHETMKLRGVGGSQRLQLPQPGAAALGKVGHGGGVWSDWEVMGRRSDAARLREAVSSIIPWSVAGAA